MQYWSAQGYHAIFQLCAPHTYVSLSVRDLIEVRDSPHGIFVSWARWNRAQPRFQSSWETAVVVAAAATVVVSWKFRSTFRPGNYSKRFS